MASADDYVMATFDEESTRMEFTNVAIFFTSLSGEPVKIGRLREPKTKLTAEQAEEVMKQYQWREPEEREEGTHVSLSFEEHPAIDATLGLTLFHVYTPPPTDRQRETGVVPDKITERRTLHLGKVNLLDTPMYRKVILAAKDAAGDNGEGEL